MLRKTNPEKIAEIEEAAEEDNKIRLNAAGIIRIRKKYKLTQSELAKLLDSLSHHIFDSLLVGTIGADGKISELKPVEVVE